MSMNSENTAPLIALRRFSCLSAALATKPEDRVAVCIGASPVILVAACDVALSVRLATLLWIKQTLQSGNQLFRLTVFRRDRRCSRRRPAIAFPVQLEEAAPAAS